MKTQSLLAGTEEGIRWEITLNMYDTGGFKAKGRLRQWVPSMDKRGGLRHKDRSWFITRLGKEYMKGKEVHHEWDSGAACFLLSPYEHRKRHR